jgi:hypothetical protein
MSTSQRVSRGFHRLGLFLAAILLVVGLVFMALDLVHLKLFETLPRLEDLPVLVFGILAGLIGLGVACLAVYGLVRAIGWVIGGFAAS